MNYLKSKHQGIFFMVLASLFFSIMGGMVKYATETVPFMEAVFFRSAVMVILLSPWMLIKKISFLGRNKLLMFVRVIAGFSSLCLSFYVVTQINLADASILNRTSVPFVALLSILFLRERVTIPLMIYIICSLIGAALIVKPQFDIVNVPGLLGLLSGFLAAIAYISVKTLRKTESFFTIVFDFALFGTMTSFVLSYQHFILPPLSVFAALICVGLFGTIAQLLMTYSFKYSDASIVTPFTFTTVIFSATWGGIFWGELPDQWSIFGAFLIIACGVGIMNLKQFRKDTVIEYGEELADQTENKV